MELQTRGYLAALLVSALSGIAGQAIADSHEYINRITPVSDRSMIPSAVGIVRVGLPTDGVVSRSGSTGATTFATAHNWHALTTMPGSVIHQLSFVDTRVGYAAGEHGEVWKTIDGGTSWSPVLFSGYTDYWYGIHALNARDVVATGFYDMTTAGAIIRWSHDGGATWDDQIYGDAGGPWLGRSGFLDTAHGLVFGHLSSASGNVALTTSNGGSAAGDWAAQSIDFDGWFGDQTSILANGHARISGINFCSSVDFGVAWTCGPSIDSVFDGATFFADDDHGWVGAGSIIVDGIPADEGWVHRTVDGGKTWSDRTFDGPWPVRELLFADAQTGWAAGGDWWQGVGGIYFSADGGVSWTFDLDAGHEISSCADASGRILCAGFAQGISGWETTIYALDFENVFADGFEDP